MSGVKAAAVDFLVRYLESESATVYGGALASMDYAATIHSLRREQLIVPHRRHEWINCPECLNDLARVTVPISEAQHRGNCPACGDIEIPAQLAETYRIAIPRFLNYLVTGLGLPSNGIQPVQKDQTWYLGRSESKAKRFHSWYFGRRLDDQNAAAGLRQRIESDRAASSCTVLTSTDLSRLEMTRLCGIDSIRLDAVALLAQSRLEFDWARLDASPGIPLEENSQQATTLRYVRAKRHVLINGVRYELSPQEWLVLIAFLDHPDHELSLDGMKIAANTQAQHFKANKVFKLHPEIYTLIDYDEVDKVYRLRIPEEDFGLRL